jgi:hypothetical protein
LPEPDGPMIAVSRLASNVMSTWSRAVTRVLPDP